VIDRGRQAKGRSGFAGWLALAVTAGLTACAAPGERITLLPDRDGKVGFIEIRAGDATVPLGEAYGQVVVRQSALVAERLDQPRVRERYGAVIDALPAAPMTFMLNFEFATDALTPASRVAVNELREQLRRFPAPEVVVIGHADAVGNTAYNDRLSLDRAHRVRDILVASGIARDQIQIVARGARDPLVSMPQGVREPRNRRAEIKLR
jgi:outer membrane protein OmpA-like peptidoglycan-associated protein